MERRSGPHTRPQYLLFMLATLVLCLFGGAMLLANEIKEAEQVFERDTDEIAFDLRQKLQANDAVLSGFAAFLQAVDSSDQQAARRYAAAALAPYPHIYMLEVARQVYLHQQVQFADAIRKSGQADFTIRNFAEITGRPPVAETMTGETWPVVFLFPEPPSTRDIYGVRLETVPFLLETLQLSPRYTRPVASPVFQLKEGGNAFILLINVERPVSANIAGRPNYFGDSMVAMLLTRTESLIPRKLPLLPTGIMATLSSEAGGQPARLFELTDAPANWLDRLTLPNVVRVVETGTPSQPVKLQLQRQLRWGNVFSHHGLFMSAMIVGITLLLFYGLIRHRRAVQVAVLEHERAEYLAMHDALTGLPNRYLLADRVAQALQRTQRHGVLFALILIDLDDFKAINDTLGHDVGDAVLIKTGERLADAVRGSDTVARYGGDEFIVVISDLLSEADALALGDKLCREISAPMNFGIRTMQVTCSLGIALCPDDGVDFNTLRQRADQAMYRAKRLGRNRAQLASQAA